MRYIQFKVDDNSAIFRIKSDSDNLKNYLPKEISNRIVSLVDVMNEYEKYREILKNSKEKILLKTLGSFGGSLTSFTLAYLIGSTPVDNDEVLGQFIATIGLGALGTGLGYKGVKEISTLSEYDKVHQKYNDSIENLNNELYEKIEDLTERGYFVQLPSSYDDIFPETIKYLSENGHEVEQRDFYKFFEKKIEELYK